MTFRGSEKKWNWNLKNIRLFKSLSFRILILQPLSSFYSFTLFSWLLVHLFLSFHAFFLSFSVFHSSQILLTAIFGCVSFATYWLLLFLFFLHCQFLSRIKFCFPFSLFLHICVNLLLFRLQFFFNFCFSPFSLTGWGG